MRMDSPGIQSNQPKRLNASFVVLDDSHSKTALQCRPVRDTESPLRGWVLLNYASNSLQLHPPDGTLLQDIGIGAPSHGQSSSSRSILASPLPGHTIADDSKLKQLSAFCSKLQDQTYRQAVVDMINGSLAASPILPSQYSELLSAIEGESFALT